MSDLMWASLSTKEYADRMPGAPDTYKNDIWNRQAKLYEEMWNYFKGDIFAETVHNRTDDKKYPLGINLFETACLNHRAVLLGEFANQVWTVHVESDNGDKVQLEKRLNAVLRASHMNALLLEGAFINMVLGGIVLRAVYDPIRKTIRIRIIPPDAFYPIWNPEDYHELLECYVANYIDGRTASLRYNVDVGRDSSNPVLVLEHWTRTYYEVTVDGKPAFWDAAQSLPMSGKNEYYDPATKIGILPFEYIPRDRCGEFYGIPLGKNLLRLQDEYNLRHADMGDAVMASTHRLLFLRNRPKGDKGLEKLNRTGLNDLGMTGPGQDAPEVFDVDAGEVSPQAVAWLDSIKREARVSTYTPDVAFGEDEGSQRSALTLAFRMWPMMAAVRTTRAFWGDGFESFLRKLIIVAATRKVVGFSTNHATDDYFFTVDWAPSLPRDREAEVNEVIVRKSAGLISVETAIARLDDQDEEWTQAEIARIEGDQEAAMQRTIKESQATATPFGGGGSGNKSGPTPSRVPDQ